MIAGHSTTLVLAAAVALGTASLVVLNVLVIPDLYPGTQEIAELSPEDTLAPPSEPEEPSATRPAELRPQREPMAMADVTGELEDQPDIVEPEVAEPNPSETTTGEMAVDAVAGIAAEAPAEETAVDETAVDETAVDETAVDETAVDETAVPAEREQANEAPQGGAPTETWVVGFARGWVRPQRAARALDAATRYHRAHPGFRVTIVGHADMRGAEDANLDLSRQRAESVARLLRQRGVLASAISISFHGESRLAARGDHDHAHARNRRVEIEIRGAAR